VTAAGGEAPAFSGSLQVPGDVSVTRPAPTTGYVVTIARTSDLVVEWTGGTIGDVAIGLVPTDRAARGGLTCAFPAAAGHGTVAAAALAELPAGKGLFVVDVSSSQDLSRDGWRLTYSLTGTARSPLPKLGGFPLSATFE
jgi:hypothetical protein